MAHASLCRCLSIAWSAAGLVRANRALLAVCISLAAQQDAKKNAGNQTDSAEGKHKAAVISPEVCRTPAGTSPARGYILVVLRAHTTSLLSKGQALGVRKK